MTTLTIVALLGWLYFAFVADRTERSGAFVGTVMAGTVLFILAMRSFQGVDLVVHRRLEHVLIDPQENSR